MCRIAVLDDDRYWCMALQRFLRNNFEVCIFNDANALIEELIHDIQRYDLIMVDLSLPAEVFSEIDGRKFIRYLRDVLLEPPVLVLVTAFISKNDIDSGNVFCKEADAFLAKDSGFDKISSRLEELLINGNR